MATIPTRLATVSTVYKNHDDARRAGISAYRRWYRSVPEICTLYSLSVSPSIVRLKIRQDFERNRHVSDLKVVNMLLLKDRQEYQETMNCWKQESHVLHWFKKYDDPATPQTFLEKFYAGKDDPKMVLY